MAGFLSLRLLEFLGCESVNAATLESGMKNKDLDLMRDPLEEKRLKYSATPEAAFSARHPLAAVLLTTLI